jgi:DNA-binding response OmpR family regulator
MCRGRKPIPLAPKEFLLLEYLMRHPGQVLTRKMIIEPIWDYGYGSFANAVDATTRRLRLAVGDGNECQLSQTVCSVGHKITA